MIKSKENQVRALIIAGRYFQDEIRCKTTEDEFMGIFPLNSINNENFVVYATYSISS